MPRAGADMAWRELRKEPISDNGMALSGTKVPRAIILQKKNAPDDN
jgi:hypothetical protein